MPPPRAERLIRGNGRIVVVYHPPFAGRVGDVIGFRARAQLLFEEVQVLVHPLAFVMGVGADLGPRHRRHLAGPVSLTHLPSPS